MKYGITPAATIAHAVAPPVQSGGEGEAIAALASTARASACSC
jgi:hypothetical protein